MTKPEQQILFSLNGKFDSFLENHAEYKKEMKDQLKSIHNKIDQGQKDDYARIKNNSQEINDPDKGLKARVASLERTRNLVIKGAGYVGGSSTVGALLYTFKEKIISFFT
jgi:hypothetical protein